ncbi:MAG: type II secretion system F family protein [Anaerolineae bacterium]
MSSLTSSQKPTAKSLFEELTGFDLYYQLTYMSATSAAGLSRAKLLDLAAKLPARTSRFFAQVNTLTNELHYDIPHACRMVGEKAKFEAIKSFLLRLSDALRSGEPLGGFLSREARVQAENYSNEYERNMESLKNWSDAYSSLVVSVALIIIINLVSTIIYTMSTGLMAGMISMAMFFSFFGAWILARSAPKETMTVPAALGSAMQRRARRVATYCAPLAGCVALLLIALGLDKGWVLIISSLFLLPPGIIALRADRETARKETETSSFLRSLGGVASSTGTTLTEALGRMDLASFPALEEDVKRLRVRLRARIDPGLCWRSFGSETGSQLATEATGIFQDAISMGGDPEEVGVVCSDFTMKTSMLRAKRRIVSSSFSGLTMVMHATVSALLVIVLEIISQFRALIEGVLTPEAEGEASQAMQLSFMTFNTAQMDMLDAMTVGMVIFLAIVNATAVTITDGGLKFKICFSLSILLIISGVSFLVGPALVAGVMKG